jgi:general secretion pathway protein G
MARDMRNGKRMSKAEKFSSGESQLVALLSWVRAKGGSPTSRRAKKRGFTLIELMIVIAIIMILIGIAAGMYQRSVHRAREATLRSDLTVMRQAIDHYTLDKEAAPQSLEDLVNPQSQYLREIPTDPITNAKDWHVDVGDTVMSPDQSTTGIVDVHSNSDKVSPFDGTPYNTW